MKCTIWTHVSVAVLTLGLLAPAALSQQQQSGERQRSEERQQSQERQQSDQDQQNGQGRQQQSAGQRSQRDVEEREGSESKARDTRQLKAIDLQHREPQQIQQILALKVQGVNPQPFGQPAQGFGGQAAGRAVGPGQTAQRTQAQSQDHKQPPAIAVDAENKVLFVRGTEDQIAEVEELVEAFDKPNDQLEKHDIGDTRLIPVSQQDSGRVRTTLAQLQLPHQMVSLGDVSLIAVCQGESDEDKRQAEQVEQVISKLQGSKQQGQETSARRDSGNEAESRGNNRTNTDDE